MILFDSVESLCSHIEKDIYSKSLCPVRFINVETMDIWIKVKSFLGKLCSKTISLSQYCADDDITPNLNRFKMTLRNLQENTLIIPLSEHLRINNPIANRFLTELLNLNFLNNETGNLKIYIPVYRMKSVLNNLILNPKNKDSVLCISTMEDVDYSLTIIQDSLNANAYDNEIEITGYRNYLIYWEQNPDKPIIFYTQNAVHFSDVIFADDVRVIISAYDLLSYYYKLPEFMRPEWGDNEKWIFLLEIYNKYVVSKDLITIDTILSKVLDVGDFDVALFKQWKTKNADTQWLIWIWMKYKSKRSKNGYLELVAEESNSVEDFVLSVFITIIKTIDSKNYAELYKERFEIITHMQIVPPAEFWYEYEKLSPLNKFKTLTNITEKEQTQFFFLLKDLSLSEIVLQLLSQNYPELAKYLSTSEMESAMLTEYFEQYKRQKALNMLEDDFLLIVDELAKNHCEAIWQLPARNATISDLYRPNASIILFVDAFGAEYIDIITALLKECGLYVAMPIYTHCNIPSTTEQNKDFLVDFKNEKYFELDKIKHGNSQYPYNLLKEFAILKDIVDKISGLLNDSGGITQVILTADHGTSRLAVLAKGIAYETGNNAEKYKYGRYCLDNTQDYSNYIGCINKDNYWIFANYNRFSSPGTPLLETHGGATLEECIIPILQIYKSAPQEKESINIKITLFSDNIKLSPNQTVKVEFTLGNYNEHFQNLVAVVNNKRYDCIYDNEKYYFIQEIKNDITTYTARIVGKEIIGNITYKVVKGISSNFDI